VKLNEALKVGPADSDRFAEFVACTLLLVQDQNKEIDDGLGIAIRAHVNRLSRAHVNRFSEAQIGGGEWDLAVTITATYLNGLPSLQPATSNLSEHPSYNESLLSLKTERGKQLNHRTIRILNNNGICNVSQLKSKKRSEVAALMGMGEHSVNNLEWALGNIGLSFAPEK
jgi:DNA-directed RNA polymerase alpha subunit